MKKQISFRTFSKYCKWHCYYKRMVLCNENICTIDNDKCTEKNCPVWKRLRG